MPELRQSFVDAVNTAVVLDGEDTRAAWELTLWTAQSFADLPMKVDEKELRTQATSTLILVLLSHVGALPPALLVRELERRIETLPTVRSDVDARQLPTAEAIQAVIGTARTALRVAAVYNPRATRN